MKTFSFDIDKYQAEWILRPIRSKGDVIVLLMRAMKVMSLRIDLQPDLVVGSIILHVDKTSRLFFVSERKIFSINFPFFVVESDLGLDFKSNNHSDVDGRVTSEIIALLDSGAVFDSSDFVIFAEALFALCDLDYQLWALIRDLLAFEDGYLRYDHDPVNEDGHRHPLHHIDVFYSNSSTFKIGLVHAIDQVYLNDVLSAASNCHYLSAAQG